MLTFTIACMFSNELRWLPVICRLFYAIIADIINPSTSTASEKIFLYTTANVYLLIHKQGAALWPTYFFQVSSVFVRLVFKEPQTNLLHITANPRISRLIRSEKSSRNTKTRKVNNWSFFLQCLSFPLFLTLANIFVTIRSTSFPYCLENEWITFYINRAS
jgi:hypothetical protein